MSELIGEIDKETAEKHREDFKELNVIQNRAAERDKYGLRQVKLVEGIERGYRQAANELRKGRGNGE